MGCSFLAVRILSCRSELCLPVSPASFAAKIKDAFWISTYSFVFPVLLSVAQIVSYMASKNYILAMYIEQVNIHFTIIGLVFATVWAAERDWENARRKGRSRAPSQVSTICFAPAHQHFESRGGTTLAKSFEEVPAEHDSCILDSRSLMLETARHVLDELGIV